MRRPVSMRHSFLAAAAIAERPRLTAAAGPRLTAGAARTGRARYAKPASMPAKCPRKEAFGVSSETATSSAQHTYCIRQDSRYFFVVQLAEKQRR